MCSNRLNLRARRLLTRGSHDGAAFDRGFGVTPRHRRRVRSYAAVPARPFAPSWRLLLLSTIGEMLGATELRTYVPWRDGSLKRKATPTRIDCGGQRLGLPL